MAELLERHLPSLTGRNIALSAALSLGLLVLVLLLAAAVVTLWPADHFSASSASPLARHHPALRLAARVAKNLLGLLLLAAGVVLSLPGVPGPGLVVVFIGISLLDLPGKRRAELWILRRPAVRRMIDRTRARFGKPKLQLDDEPAAADGSADHDAAA